MTLWNTIVFIILVVNTLIIKAEVLIDNDGGYKNIIVGITPDVPESDVDGVLYQLEAVFKSTSSALLTASKGNVFFKEVVFAIPKKYKESITRRKITRGAKYFKEPDILLTENDIYVNPYTIQNGGCGKPGLRIHIPRDFLRTSSKTDKGITLVRQWAHYRYGVFSESGFTNDELYPTCYIVPGTDSIKVNDCTNSEAEYEYNRPDYYEYSTNECSPIAKNGKNDHIISSLMTNIDFPKMRYFCDNETYPHNRNARTKQNVLCREQSTWEVISKHSDFKIKRKSSSNVKPTFKYILESDPRLIVAVDSSKDMEQNGRMELVRNAFAYFVLYDLPINSSIGLIDMKNKKDDPELNTIQSQEEAERLIFNFPDAYGDGDICVHCTIQKMIEILKLDISNIIIITATDMAENWVDNIITMLKSSNVALHAMYFQEKLMRPAILEKVAKSSGGTFHYIAETFPTDSFTSTLTLLYESFRSVYESFSWMNRHHVLVDQKTFTSNCRTPKCVLSFPTDSSIKSFHVLITSAKFGGSTPVLKDSIILNDGEQSFVSTNRSFTIKSQIPAYLFTIEDPQPRLWNLTFERRSGNNEPIVVIIRAANSDYRDILQLQSWISFEDNQNVSPMSPPITIFSEIRKDNSPVTGTKVVAYIHQMSYNKQMTLDLIDSGDGDPDITRNDGIYSRYLTGIEDAGYHSVTTIAERWTSQSLYRTLNAKEKELYCCGSSIPNALANKAGPFKRVTTHQSFFVQSALTNKNYPPRRVMDLRVLKIEILEANRKCYLLKWTAPGDSGDKGTAAEYDIRVFNSRNDALNKFDSEVLKIRMLNIQGPLLVPFEAGTIHTVYIELTNLTNGNYFIGLKTKSYSGRISDISNLVEVFHIDPTSVTGIGGSSPNPYYTYPDGGTTESNVGNDGSLSTNVKLAIGLSCGFILLCIIIGIIIFFCCEKRRKEDDRMNPVHNSKKTESKDALCNGNGGGHVAIISPVTSWGADSLITHYETLHKDKNTELKSVVTDRKSNDVDSVSFSSSKYSYDNKIDQHSLYDPIYYHQVRSQEELNYPYNSAYATGPFSPIYTSSLRRNGNLEVLGIPDPSETSSFYNYNPNNLSRLKTDV